MSGDPRPVGEDDLHGLIDGRLEPERQALVEAWLVGNPARAAEVSTDRVLRERLRARLAPIAEEAIPARLRVANIRSRHLYPGARWFPMAAAAVLCLALGSAGGWVGHALHGVPAAAAVAEAPATQDAVAAFRTFVVEAVHPVEVRADEKPHLVTWLSKRLGHAVAAPDLSAQGFRLMGGRLLPAGTEPAAMLMYDDDRGTRLTLYSRVGDGDGRTLFRFAREGDIAAFSWVDGGMSYVVTGRTDEARLLSVAQAVDAHVRDLAPDRRQP
ncbi:anti-sigma factor RsiW [Methylobacterium sp. PvP062]|jgi:anti-sigma factor RsiW|uniref:Anti-sigma factor n=3 Tax=Methylobacterium TaxID=407 RepID=A0ABV1R8A4_9HYPH|nr:MULTISPECIES: anti-sigma factor [Methylobacterium]KIU28352.1 anti-sigma factor [Methylobacterium radiotolerans]MCX7335012.1 anti-sigma factor [Hyphomicrobiales bacterium]AWV15296.1 anti-sigma factor [Methylobacterium sp. XJLW]MBP2497998.1 anti-sigma factor RsiW [Methylobacterium sp. PvP105]MBP2502131.1 anti-sigma factor RsiW [Methylobacterium sp. PvP109]